MFAFFVFWAVKWTVRVSFNLTSHTCISHNEQCAYCITSALHFCMCERLVRTIVFFFTVNIRFLVLKCGSKSLFFCKVWQCPTVCGTTFHFCRLSHSPSKSQKNTTSKNTTFTTLLSEHPYPSLLFRIHALLISLQKCVQVCSYVHSPSPALHPLLV